VIRVACCLGEDNNLLLIFGGFGPITLEQAEIVRKKRRIAEVEEEGGDAEDLEEAEEDDEDEEEEIGLAGDEDAQLLFAWFNDAFVLDCKEMTWHKCVETNKEVPIERCAAAMSTVDAEHALLFGGRCIDGERSNDCWQATIIKRGESIEWKKIVTTNTPAERSFHTMVTINEDDKKYAVVCGGLSNSMSYFGDICILDLTSNKWSLHNNVEGFIPRENHRATVFDDTTMIVYGGGSVIDVHNGTPTQLLSDTVAIDISKLI